MERFERICRLCTLIKLSDEDLEWLYPDCTTDEAVKILLDLGIPLVRPYRGEGGGPAWSPLPSRSFSPLYDPLRGRYHRSGGTPFHGALLTFSA